MPLQPAILVDDHGQPHRRLLEFVEHLEHGRGFVDQQRLADDSFEIERAAGQELVQEMLLGHCPHQLVDAAAAHDELLVPALAERLRDVFVTVVEIDPVDFGTRGS